MDRQPVRDRLLDDHGVRRQHLAQLVSDPTRVDGLFVLQAQGLLAPLPPSLFGALAPLLRPLGALPAVLRQAPLQTVNELLQRAFDLSGEAEIDLESPVGLLRPP